MDDPKVFVVCPYYMNVCGDVIDSHYRVGRPDQFIPAHFGDAFLARNFNACWVEALNSRKEFGWTHLLMVHADVQPMVDDWGVILVNEMKRTGADFLSVVLPIKSEHGQTSTAVEDREGRIRMLTMKEIDALNHVSFDAPLAGFLDCKILCSTGLWICKFDEPWVGELDDRGYPKLWFEVRDKIVFDPSTGKYDRVTVPEDWHFSRLLHGMGKKVMATRRVPCQHFGQLGFMNAGRWGTLEQAPWHGPFPWVKECH